MLSYVLSFIPGTGPYYKKFLKLEQLKRLPDEWDRSPISYYKVKRACALMNDFTSGMKILSFKDDDVVFTSKGFVSIDDTIRKHMSEGTTKRLMRISQECLEFILARHLKLDNMKVMLREWNGERLEVVRDNLYEYATTLRKLKSLDDDLFFYESVEEFVEKYLGEELYERLETMIRFFKQLDHLRRSIS